MKKIQIILLLIGAIVISGCFGEDLSELKRIVEINNKKEPEPEPEPGTKPESGKDTTFVDDYEFIDLGLSVKWANKNLGAADTDSLGNRYKLVNKDGVEAQNVDISGTLYDPAYTLNNAMRLPTCAQWNELQNCTWKYEALGSHFGFRVTGSNGNSIFFPMDPNDLSRTVFNYWTGDHYQYNSEEYYIFRISYSSGRVYTSSYEFSSSTYLYVRPVQTK